MKTILTLLASAAMAAAATLALPPELPVAQATPDGKTLVVSKEDQAKGTVYYAITGRDRQIYFESNAPLEDIKGQSNAVIGYAVLSPNNPGTLAAGQWHLPVSSMRTGIELRDEHLAGKDWLDAKGHPNIIVQVREMRNVRETKKSQAFTTYTGTLVADVTMHGVTKTMPIEESSITLMPASEATAKVAKGDLLAIRTKFKVTLADFEVKHPVIGEKVASEVEIQVALYLSTLPPSSQQ